VKYYFTSDFSNSFFTDALLNNEVDNLLVSFASAQGSTLQRKTDKALTILNKYRPDTNIIIDSGAFSAWNSGYQVNRDELLHFYKEIKKEFPHANFINLDVIPGEKGRKPTEKEADLACQLSWENFLWFKQNGIMTLPVFHEDDNWDYLHMMMNETDYIAISPANDSSTKRRMVWLDRTYSILKADYKTHGLAATSKKLLERYPFYSVDSINWKTVLIFANQRSFNGEQTLPRHIVSQLAKNPNTMTQLLNEEITKQIKLEKYITKLWASRGVQWE
jgi:hypothetical protein